MKCPRHPKYKGKKDPPDGCWVCLSTFLLVLVPRIGVMYTKVVKSKKTYSRKRKVKDEQHT